jgi:site-specific DNA-methyltransferase (cytosine-N4-specific)
MIRGSAERVLKSSLMAKYKGKVQLIFTSPPFPLNRKKKYGNFTGEKYSEWLADFAKIFSEFLTEDGSIVIEMGNAWVKGEPTMSTLALKALLAFQEKGNLKLCQQFIAYNKARLPSPAQWVNVKRIRVKDAYTSIWWMSPVATPKADNRRVLKEYSESMHELLSSKKYNSGRRPSEHLIGAKSFLKDNKGAIPPNVIIVSNTIASDRYVNYCRNRKITPHPARMPKKIPEFFIKFLTDPGDIVVDPFAGSNVTGWVADILGRKWISIEKDESYANVSKIRFAKSVTTKKLGRKYAKRGKRGPKK